MKAFKGQVYVVNNSTLEVSKLREAGAIPSDLTDTQAELVLVRGAELGISQITALSEIRIREGKTVVSFDLFRSLIYRSALVAFEQKIETLEHSTVKIIDVYNRVEQATFSTKEARKLGLLEKQSWKNNQKEMLYQRAFLQAARKLFPHITLGLTTQDEYVASLTTFEKVWKWLVNFRTKKAKARIVKVSLSKLADTTTSSNSNSNSTRTFARKAIELSKNQLIETQNQSKAIKAS